MFDPNEPISNPVANSIDDVRELVWREIQLQAWFEHCGLSPRELHERDNVHNVVVEAINSGIVTLSEVGKLLKDRLDEIAEEERKADEAIDAGAWGDDAEKSHEKALD